MELELELELKITELELELNWKNGIDPNPDQRGAGPPAGAGSVFRAGRVFILARVRAQFHFTGPPFRGTGPCLTTATWRCRKNFSQWECSFHWKLRCHWLEFLRQRQIAVVRQGPGSLIYKYRPISAPYSCGSRRRIAPWAISAGARRGGRAGPRRCKQHHTIPSNRSTVTVGERTVVLKIIARCSITQTPTGQWNIDNVAV